MFTWQFCKLNWFYTNSIRCFKAITTLKIIISNLKTDITDKSEAEKKKIFAEQENFLSNAEMFLKKRGELIDQFSKNNIISKDEKFYDAPEKIKKSTPEKSVLSQ